MSHAPQRWKPPAPLGLPAAIESMGLNAAPLFCGFSLTLIGLIIQSPGPQMRFRDATLLLLVVSLVAFVYCVQATYASRQFAAGPADYEAWYPGDEPAGARTVYQSSDAALLAQYMARARISYNVGIVVLLAALCVALVPPAGHHSVPRWAAVVVAGAAVLGELLWLAATHGASRGPRASRGERFLMWIAPRRSG